jgi:hypothetical protein
MLRIESKKADAISIWRQREQLVFEGLSVSMPVSYLQTTTGLFELTVVQSSTDFFLSSKDEVMGYQTFHLDLPLLPK